MKQDLSWQERLAMLSSQLPEGEETQEETTDEKTPQQRCGKISIHFEKKGRARKQATILTGLDNLTDDEIASLAADIKRRLGTGGSVRGAEILVQGDRRTQLSEYLKSLGYKTNI